MLMQPSGRRWRSGRFSLSFRLSLLLLLAAIIPLIITVTSDDLLARSRLIDQGTKALQTDAHNKADLINTYIHERKLDALTLANIDTTKQFFADVDAGLPPHDLFHSYIALGAGAFRDNRYVAWSYVDLKGHVDLSTDQKLMAPGAVQIPADELQAEQNGHEYLSPVYFDPETRHAVIQIAAPAFSGANGTGAILGYIRATLHIDYIWDIVASDAGTNGDKSAAFIVDENGVRIADTDVNRRFTAVAPLAPAVQTLITSQSRYGTAAPVAVDPLPQVANALSSQSASSLFQAPAFSNNSTNYQFVGQRLTEVPWTYFVLSPLPTVTAVADTQIEISFIIAGIVAVIAAVVGLIIGRSTAKPVLSSVSELRSATTSLNTLGTQQESAASEQVWMVDACKSGVENISYLANATKMAAAYMIQAGNMLGQQWGDLSPEEITHAAQMMVKLARYIESASNQQQESTERLSTAIKVTNQVSDQLATSAEAAGKYANQLERVVEQLQRLVGVERNASSPMN